MCVYLAHVSHVRLLCTIAGPVVMPAFKSFTLRNVHAMEKTNRRVYQTGCQDPAC